MTTIIKIIWSIAIIVVFASMIWFLFATTAFFSRGIDLITTIQYIFVWTPALIFVIISILVLVKNWMPNEMSRRVSMLLIILIVSTGLSTFLFTNANTQGWLTEIVRSDYLQITPDGRYKYRLDLINHFQRNSSARLYVRRVSTDEEFTIPLDISTRNMPLMPMPHGRSFYWITLNPTDIPGKYIAQTTDALTLHFTETFQINMNDYLSHQLLKEVNYRSSFRRIGERGNYRFTYSLILIDKYLYGINRIDSVVILYVNDHTSMTSHQITLPVDIAIIADNNLWRERHPLWVSMVETDIEGKFIVQTTDEFSVEIILSFIIDIETATAHIIE